MKNLKRRENMLVRSYQHYNRTKFEDDVNKGRVYETCFSHVDPTLSHLNYNLHSGNMIENYNNIKNGVYIKNEKDFVAYCDLCITLPKDYEGDSKIFFKNVYDILMHDDKFKHCIGAFVHLDETSPHMHFIYMPIVEQEKDIQRQVKVYSEKKKREVTKRMTFHYNSKFDAKSILSLQNLKELHPWMQKQLEDRNIHCTIITKERIEYNKFKAEIIEQTNNLILADPENKDFYINDMFKALKEQNPREYKKRFERANQGRFNFFLSMLDTAQKDALKDAGVIVDNAKQEATQIIDNAKEEAGKIISDAKNEADKENERRLRVIRDKESRKRELKYFTEQVNNKRNELSSLEEKIASLEAFSKSIIDMATLEANEIIDNAKKEGKELIKKAEEKVASMLKLGEAQKEKLIKDGEAYFDDFITEGENEYREIISKAKKQAKEIEDKAKTDADEIINDAKEQKKDLEKQIAIKNDSLRDIQLNYDHIQTAIEEVINNIKNPDYRQQILEKNELYLLREVNAMQNVIIERFKKAQLKYTKILPSDFIDEFNKNYKAFKRLLNDAYSQHGYEVPYPEIQPKAPQPEHDFGLSR